MSDTELYNFLLSIQIPPADVEEYVQQFLHNGFESIDSIKADMEIADMERYFIISKLSFRIFLWY